MNSAECLVDVSHEVGVRQLKRNKEKKFSHRLHIYLILRHSISRNLIYN